MSKTVEAPLSLAVFESLVPGDIVIGSKTGVHFEVVSKPVEAFESKGAEPMVPFKVSLKGPDSETPMVVIHDGVTGVFKETRTRLEDL